jgi:Cu(I)-responsive transcriptional regulator
MQISETAELTGLPAKTIRYYEEIGLVAPARSENGYRTYNEQQVHRLAFLQRARALGFSIEECRLLLSLYDDKRRASSHVKQIAREKVAEIDGKITKLESMRATLAHLADTCHGDDRPECPILEDLASG